jgi:hypothetical protein
MERIIPPSINLLQLQKGIFVLIRFRNEFMIMEELCRERKIEGVKAVLSTVGRKMNEKSDGSKVFCLGDSMSGKASGVGKYAGFQNLLVKKLRELKSWCSDLNILRAKELDTKHLSLE